MVDFIGSKWSIKRGYKHNEPTLSWPSLSDIDTLLCFLGKMAFMHKQARHLKLRTTCTASRPVKNVTNRTHAHANIFLFRKAHMQPWDSFLYLKEQP